VTAEAPTVAGKGTDQRRGDPDVGGSTELRSPRVARSSTVRTGRTRSSAGRGRVSAPVGLRDRLAVTMVAVAVACMPLLTPSGPGNTAPVDAVAALAVGVVVFWLASTGNRMHLPYVWPVWILSVGGLIAAGLGPTPLASGLAVIQDLFLLLWCAAVVNVSRTPYGLAVVIGTWAWSAIAWAALLLFYGLQNSDVVRGALTFGNPNLAASYFVVSLMVVLASGRPRHRIVRLAGCMIILAAIVITGSLAGLVGVVAAGISLGLFTIIRRGGIVPAAAALILVAIVAGSVGIWISQAHVFERASASTNIWLYNSLGRAEESGLHRGSLMREEFNLFWQGSILGIGPGATEWFLSKDQSLQTKEAHNDYLAVLVERGILGLAGLLLLIGALFVRAKAISVRLLSPEFAKSVPIPAALASGLVALAASAMFHEVLHFRHVWALFGVVAALYLWGLREGLASSAGSGP
jgi:O-antigen ligase